MSTETIRPIPDHLISETEEPDNPPLQLSLPLDVG